MLKHAIAYIQQLEQDFNRREALVRTVINADKQAKVNERIRFLLECKRASLYPRFISNSVHNVSYMFKNNATVERHRQVFCRQLLNEAIKEAFRTQAFRIRESKRLQRVLVQHHWQRLVEQLANEVYEDARQKSSTTLKKKFLDLCRSNKMEAKHHCADSAADEDDAGQPEQALDGLSTCISEQERQERPIYESNDADRQSMIFRENQLETETWYCL